MHAVLKMFFLFLLFRGAFLDQNNEFHEDFSLGPDDIAKQQNGTDLPTFEEFMNDYYDIGEFNDSLKLSAKSILETPISG